MKADNMFAKVELISEYFVKPKHEVEASKQPHYLNPVDILFLSLEHMQKGLLFPTKPKNFQHDLLDKLKDSISHSLVHYYPLAGRLATKKFPDEHASWVYVDCRKGPGARLIHARATVNLSVADILGSVDVHPVVRSFFDFGEKPVNHDGHSRPLLSIQVTELVDGVFIGFTVNHSLGDGACLWNYISALSKTFLQLTQNSEIEDDSSVIPISNKPIFKPHFIEEYGPILKLPFLEPDEYVVRYDPGSLRERIFHFTLDSVSKLKAVANEQCGVTNISSFQALSGFLWRSVTRARNLQPHQQTNCCIIISSRDRLKPSYSVDYFGNYLARTHGSCTVGEILGNDFGWAALLVHNTLAAQDENAVRNFVEMITKTPVVASLASKGSEGGHYLPNSVSIAGSARFDMYGPEFGLGKAVAVLAGYGNKDDGKVTANPGREGGGSVDLEVCLKPQIMDALELDEEFMSFVS